MKGQQIAILGGIALLLLVFSKNASGARYTGDIDLSKFNDTYGAENVARLQKALTALSTGLTDLQVRMLLAQILVETGLFTDNPNYRAVDQLNNYAGIMSGGSLKQYITVDDFVSDYIRVLLRDPGEPLYASNINDFNNKLAQNGYYGSDSQSQYGQNLNFYFNLLS